jgi:opacity protein-like surface antigen
LIKRMLWPLVLGTAVLPAAALAQPASPPSPSSGNRAFVAIHVGAQTGSSDLTDGFTFPQYDETATVSLRQSYGGNPIFNIEGGARVWGQVFAGVAFSMGSTTIDATTDASIPNPIFFDQPRAASMQTELDHRERAVHLFARYVVPINEDFEVGISAGPSFINVSHELVTDVTFEEGAAPFTTVTLTGASTRKESKTVTAANIGANVTYRLTPSLGVDGYFRYAKGAKDVTGAGGSVEIKAGGTQIGIGVRYGF